MIKGYEELDQSNCTIHRLQRSVGKYTKNSMIDRVLAKGRASVGYFNSSTIGNADLMKCCAMVNLPQTSLKQDMPVRWGTTYDMCDSIREKMQPLLLYDVAHGGQKAAKSYATNRYSTEEFSVNNQTVAVLHAAKAVTVLLQADEYPTSNMALPCLYGVIAATEATADVKLPWAPTQVILAEDLRPEVAIAREEMNADLKEIWIEKLDEHELEFMLVCVLCDPCKKAMVFPLVTPELRTKARTMFIREYDMHWAPVDDTAEFIQGEVEAAPQEEEAPVGESVELAPLNVSSFSDFMSSLSHVTPALPAPPAVVRPQRKSQAEKYLQLEAPPPHTDLLVWWGQNEDEFPDLARMAAQFLGCPASSASAERIFSLAGRLYDNLTCNMSDGKLEERMWAKLNRGKRKREQ